MAKNIKGSSLKIKDMGKVGFDGKMGESMTGNGKEANNMGLGYIKMGKERIKKDNGWKVKEYNGYHDKRIISIYFNYY